MANGKALYSSSDINRCCSRFGGPHPRIASQSRRFVGIQPVRARACVNYILNLVRSHHRRLARRDDLGLGAGGRREDIPPRAGRLGVKTGRVLFRLALLSVAAAVFVWLTEIYGGLVRLQAPYGDWQAGLRVRHSWPDPIQFPPFIGECALMVIWALLGRIVFRLRLSPASRSEKQPIALNLDGARRARRSPDTTAI